MTFEDEVVSLCKDKNTVFIFVSKDDEVGTVPIIEQLLLQRKKVVVPISIEENKTMKMSKIISIDDLALGAYGIWEPKKISVINKRDIDIFFVPGTLFDKKGNRKGRGLGYFDRFLVEVKGKKPIIGLCFKRQVVEQLEVNPWDIPVDKLIVKI